MQKTGQGRRGVKSPEGRGTHARICYPAPAHEMKDTASGVSFGLNLPQFSDYQALPRTAALADDLGFDAFGLGDHLLWHTPFAEPLTTLAACAVTTARIRLETNVLLLPLREPLWVAKAALTLDALSSGRLTLGLGIGGENPEDYAAVGVPFPERGSRMAEAVAVLRAGCAGKPITFHGRHFRLDRVDLGLRPVQPGGPPLWLGGYAPGALRRAGRLADGWLGGWATPEQFARRWAAVQEAARAAGRDPDTLAAGVSVWAYLAADKARAESVLAPWLAEVYQLPYERVARHMLVGPVEVFLDTLDAYLAAGARHIRLVLVGAEAEPQIHLMGAELLPELRRRYGPDAPLTSR